MVVAGEVQRPMYDHVRPAGTGRDVRGARLGRDHGRTDHEFAEVDAAIGSGPAPANERTLVGLPLPR